ncbi:exosome complex component RRP45, putative [Plasmodium gallinaceum]|uniref:Exosome complex component RRP45, putative n=1 Tax=Plasmodium gallinaceum TaxID=5849 RepID=A0A1J1GSH5_PLAGA|nr:exosome complex component RRP45, putative [Plasmodium gallinaceum]CRG94003.1 exosome complex component RRP45, putative [Plasmodium gallinaceum]
MKSCKNNANFFWCNLKNNLRLDGRNFEDSRNISFYFLGDYGNVEVSIGFTKVICRITSEIVKPFDKKPNEGIIKINLDIDSFTSVNDNLKINDECLEIRNLIERILKSSSILNFESLCIIPHKKVWCLLINIIVIENDGNLFDACYLSAYSALVHFRNNEVKVENSEIIIDQDESNYSPLSIHNSPILTTFAYFNSEDICLIDPSLHEEEFMSSKLSVALNKNGQLISILKPGGSPISYLKILEAIELAKKRVTCILKILEDALEEDKKLRDDLKKKNFHIKYSCNPVSIKYNDSYEKSMNIPVNQSLRNNWNIEKIIKKYEQYIKLQDMEQEENLVSSIEETNNNENTKYNKQYILNEELRKIKNENKIKHENYLYVDNYNDYMSNIKDNNFLEEPFKNKNILDNLDIGKIKRQEFGDNNSYLHNNKFLKTNDIQKKEIMNFSNTITKNIKEKKNINKENKTESMTTNKEYSSDIDFSIAINESLKKKKKKKKKN